MRAHLSQYFSWSDIFPHPHVLVHFWCQYWQMILVDFFLSRIFPHSIVWWWWWRFYPNLATEHFPSDFMITLVKHGHSVRAKDRQCFIFHGNQYQTFIICISCQCQIPGKHPKTKIENFLYQMFPDALNTFWPLLCWNTVENEAGMGAKCSHTLSKWAIWHYPPFSTPNGR